MGLYTARIHYTKDAVKQMCAVVSGIYAAYYPALLILLGVASASYGVLSGLESIKGLLLTFVGCFILTNTNLYQRNLTRRMLAVMDGWWPVMEYVFTETSILSQTDREKQTTPYTRIIRMVRTEDFDYLFITKKTAFMVDMRGMEERADLEAFLASKTNLAWKKYRGGIRFF